MNDKEMVVVQKELCHGWLLHFLDQHEFWLDDQRHNVDRQSQTTIFYTAKCLNDDLLTTLPNQKLIPIFRPIYENCHLNHSGHLCTTDLVKEWWSQINALHLKNTSSVSIQNSQHQRLLPILLGKDDDFFIVDDQDIIEKLTAEWQEDFSRKRQTIKEDLQSRNIVLESLIETIRLDSLEESVLSKSSKPEGPIALKKIFFDPNDKDLPFFILSYGTEQYRITSNIEENEHSALRVLHNHLLPNSPSSHIVINPGVANKTLPPESIESFWDEKNKTFHILHDPNKISYQLIEAAFAWYGITKNIENTLNQLKAYKIAYGKFPEKVVMVGYSRGGALNHLLANEINKLIKPTAPETVKSPRIVMFNIEPVPGGIDYITKQNALKIPQNVDSKIVIAADEKKIIYLPYIDPKSKLFIVRGSHNDPKMRNRWSGALAGHELFEFINTLRNEDNNIDRFFKIDSLKSALHLADEEIKQITGLIDNNTGGELVLSNGRKINPTKHIDPKNEYSRQVVKDHSLNQWQDNINDEAYLLNQYRINKILLHISHFNESLEQLIKDGDTDFSSIQEHVKKINLTEERLLALEKRDIEVIYDAIFNAFDEKREFITTADFIIADNILRQYLLAEQRTPSEQARQEGTDINSFLNKHQDLFNDSKQLNDAFQQKKNQFLIDAMTPSSDSDSDPYTPTRSRKLRTSGLLPTTSAKQTYQLLVQSEAALSVHPSSSIYQIQETLLVHAIDTALTLPIT